MKVSCFFIHLFCKKIILENLTFGPHTDVKADGIFRKNGKTERQIELIDLLEKMNKQLKSTSNKQQYESNINNIKKQNICAIHSPNAENLDPKMFELNSKKRKTLKLYYKYKKRDNRSHQKEEFSTETDNKNIGNNNNNNSNNNNKPNNNNSNKNIKTKNTNNKSPLTAEMLSNMAYSVHDISSVFKKYLIELKEPLTLGCYFDVIKKIAGMLGDSKKMFFLFLLPYLCFELRFVLFQAIRLT